MGDTKRVKRMKGIDGCLESKDRPAELEETEQMLRFTRCSVEHSGESAIWFDKDGRVIYVNEASCHGLGYSRQELLAMTILDIDPDYPRESKGEKQETGCSSIIYESTRRTKDGRSIPVEINANKGVFEGNEYICTFARDITERKQAEDTLRKERDFNKRLIEVSPAFIVTIDAEGKTLMMNRAMLNALGYREEEVTGTDYLATFVPPEDRDLLSGIFKELTHSTGSTYNENHLLTKDGRRLLVEWHGKPVFKPGGQFDFFFGIGIDITQRRLAEEALGESEERFRQMAELLPLTIYEADLRGNILFANHVAFNTFKYDPGDIEKGMNITDLITPEDRDAVKRNISKILGGRYTGGTEYTALRKDGTTFSIVNYASAILRKNVPVGLRGIVVDITERLEAEEKEIIYQRQLMQADKMITLGTLVSGVAHEINNPNNAIMMGLPLLKEMLDDIWPLLEERYRQSGDFEVGGFSFPACRESAERLINGMTRSSERIKSIVGDLKNFARPDPCNLEQSVQVNEVIKSSVALLENMIIKATRNFSVTYGENIPNISGNFLRLEQVVLNLIQNACQAMEDKDRAIRVISAYVQENEMEAVRIVVSDEGRGIPEKNLGFITDPFYTTRRDSGGTGLGLSVTHRIIKDHRGTLDIRSIPGTGSVFTVTLPVSHGDTGCDCKREECDEE